MILKSCSEFAVVDPIPWLKDKTQDTAVPADGATIYFPATVLPQFKVQSYANNQFCGNSGYCCNTDFVSSTIKTFYSTEPGTERAGFMTSNVAVLTLLDKNVPGFLGQNTEVKLNVKITMNTAHFSFEKTFDIKFLNCSVSSQSNYAYLINRTTSRTITFAQAHDACAAIIQIRKSDDAQPVFPWLTLDLSSKTTMTINSSQVQLADNTIGDYPMIRYVKTVTPPEQKFNQKNFIFSMCKFTPPGNNGVDASSVTQFDKSGGTGTIKLAPGTVSSGTACSNILYSVSGLDPVWMTYISGTNSIQLDLTKSTTSHTFTYKLTYNDGQIPIEEVSFSILVELINCGFTYPVQWVEQRNMSNVVISTSPPFEANAEYKFYYQWMTATMLSTNPACGTLTYTASATITSSESTTSYLSQNLNVVAVDLATRVSNGATFQMNVSVQISIPSKTQTPTFVINFFDCRVPSGTINALPNQQIEVDEIRSYTSITGYSDLDPRCANFKIELELKQPSGSWLTFTDPTVAYLFPSYQNPEGPAPQITFQIKPLLANRGQQWAFRLVLKNKGNKARIQSPEFWVSFCKAQVTQAFISPSSTALKDNVFSLVRQVLATDPKPQVILSSAYFDSTDIPIICTYTSLTIVNLDTSVVLMSQISNLASKTETLEMNSYAWTSNGQVYSRELEVKLWHNTELVWFPTAPHKFTVNIYDCEIDMVRPTQWIVEPPQKTTSNGAEDEFYFIVNKDYTVQLKVPQRNYPDICGPLVFEISSTDPLATANLVLNSSTGKIDVKTPTGVSWGPSIVNIKIKNSYTEIIPDSSCKFYFRVFDCDKALISANQASQPGGNGGQPIIAEMVSTGPDWSYTWQPFTTSMEACIIDSYQVTCTAGAYNIGSNLCSRGFKYNTSTTNYDNTALINGAVFPPMTIFAQYKEDTLISVDHEGEFTFTISGYNSLSPNNKSSFSMLLKVKTPCGNPLNYITAVTQTFQGNCRTENGKTFCDDVHYKIFTDQSNPITPFIVRFAYSCQLTYTLKQLVNGVELDVPSFVKLQDSNGIATATYPAWLNVKTELNNDKGDSDIILVLRATLAQFSNQTQFKLFMYYDCSKEKVQMLNLGQTLNTSYTVSDFDVTGIRTYLQFNKISAAKASDQKYCVVTDSGLSLHQLNMPASIVDTYNTNLFDFMPTPVAPVVGNNRINIIAGNDRDVTSVASGATPACNLSSENTRNCTIDFKIIATGHNGTYPDVATGSVVFKSECYLTLSNFEKTQGVTADKWIWAAPDQTAFKSIYQIRQEELTLALPRITNLSLPSIEKAQPLQKKTFADVCGTFVYTFTAPDPSDPFTFIHPLPTAVDGSPQMKVRSINPLNAENSEAQNYSKAYALDLTAYNYKGEWTVNYASNQAKVDALTYKIQDLCFSVTYSKPNLYYNDGRNSPQLTFSLMVSQPILFDAYDVIFFKQTYAKRNNEDANQCGKLVYNYKHDGKAQPIKWGTIKEIKDNEKVDQGNGLYFNLYANDNKYRGVYNVTYTAHLVDVEYSELYPKYETIIKVSIDDCYVKTYNASQPDPPFWLTFNIFSKPVELNFRNFDQIPACNYTQRFNITVQKVQNGFVPEFKEGSLPDPCPLNFNSMSRRLTFETDKVDLVNSTYQYTITGYLDNSMQHQKTQSYRWGPFNAIVLESLYLVDNTAPTIPGMSAGYTVFKGETSTIIMGNVFDLEGNMVNLVDWYVDDFASKWVKLSDSVNQKDLTQLSFDIGVPTDITEEQFTLYIKLSDNHSRKPITVDYIANFKIGEVNQKNNLGFSVSNNIKTQEQQFIEELPPEGIPQKISISGGFIFEFDKSVKMAQVGDINSWNSTNIGKEYFEFTLVPGNTIYYKQNEEEYKYTWNITNTTKTTITFQFIFSDYDIISQRDTDSMRFKMLRPEIFVSQMTGKPTHFTSSLQTIPKQVRDKQEQQQLVTATQTIDRLLNAVKASSFVNVILSSSLQFLWGMINALQIIVYTVLFNLKTPVNCQEIEIMILQMVQFDIFQVDKQLQKVFRFDLNKNPTLNSRFEKAQYNTSNFVLNMGDMFLMEVIYIAMLGLLPLAKWLCINQSQRIENYLASVRLFNGFARFYLESMLEISICTLITMRLMKADTWKQPQLIFNNIMAFGNLGILIVMPVILGYMAMKFYKSYHTDWAYREKFDDIFSEFKGGNKFSMLYYTFFTLRRYTMALCLIALPDSMLFQIYLQVISSSVFLLYLLHAKPHKDIKQGKVEIFNELTVSVAVYWLFIFTDLCNDSTRRYQAGWAKVLLILTNLLVNVTIMLIETFYQCKMKFKMWWIHRKLRLMQQARLDAQEAENVLVAQQVNQAFNVPIQNEELEAAVQPSRQRLEEIAEAEEIARKQQIEEEFKLEHPEQYAQVQEERKLLDQLQLSLAKAHAIRQKSVVNTTIRHEENMRSMQNQNNQNLEAYINQVNMQRYTRSNTNAADKIQDPNEEKDDSVTQLVMPSSIKQSSLNIKKQKSNKSPFEVIQEYNAKHQAQLELFKEMPSKRLQKHKKKKSEWPSQEELDISKKNVWLMSGLDFLPKEPEWFYQEHPDYKQAKDYLDKKHNRKNE